MPLLPALSEDALAPDQAAVVALFGYLNRCNDSIGTALEDMPHDRGARRLAQTTGWEIGKHGE